MSTTSERFGRYELRGILGQGGFATVYRAYDTALGREVALKALLPSLALDPELRERFANEGRALATLRQSNIVTVFDVGEANGRPFFAMELVPGDTLGQRLQQARPVPFDQAITWLRSLAAALDYLHAAGLVHRDLKPTNVMVEPDGRIVLMDLGIARSLDRTQMTRTGMSMGTPSYMSPEQVRGEPVGPSADRYALGVLAYELLAGRPPFVGDTAFVLHAQAYSEPPPLEQLRPGLPPGAYQALAQALEKQPERRPRSCSAFVEALAGNTPLPIAGTLPGFTPRPQPLISSTAPTMAYAQHEAPRPRRGVPPLLVGAIGVAVLAIAGVLALVVINGNKSGNSRNSNANDLAKISATVPPPTIATSVATATNAGLATKVSSATNASSTVVLASATPTPVSTGAAATPALKLQVTGLQLTNIDGWAAGRGALQGCPSYQGAPGGSMLRLRVAPAANPQQATADSPPVSLAAQSGSTCLSIPPQNGLAGGNYLAIVYDGNWTEQRRMAFFVQGAAGTATAAPTVAPPPSPPPTAVPPGGYARVSAPNDCVSLRERPDMNSTQLNCYYDGAIVGILDNAVNGPGGPWRRVSAPTGQATDEGYMAQSFLMTNPAATGTPSVTGDWDVTDYVRFGAAKSDDGIGFRIHLTQNGTQVSGTATDGPAPLILSGILQGRTLHANFSQSGNSGELWWTFTADSTRFAGAYGGSSGNGGTSYGSKSGATASTEPLATIFIVGPGVSGTQAKLGSTALFCYTASLNDIVALTPLPPSTKGVADFMKNADDGKGDCYDLSGLSASADGRFRIRVLLSQGGKNLAGATTMVTAR